MTLLPYYLLQAQSLDSSFNSNGIVIQDLSGSDDDHEQMMVQTDQKIVAISTNGSTGTTNIIRYKPNGTLDSSMGINGIAISPLAMASWSGAIQTDGKILAAGYDGASNFAVSRYLTDGTVDNSFGNNGMATTVINNSEPDIVTNVGLQPDGKILAFGSTKATSFPDIAVVRYHANGMVDSSFGINGIVIKDINSNSRDWIAKGLVQPDGKILLAGISGDDAFLMRLWPDGRPDSSFGTNGVVITDMLSNSDDNLESMRLQADGKILVVGWISKPGFDDGFIMRYKTNGSLDSSFGTNGRSIFQIDGSSLTWLSDLELQTDQRILISATAFVNVNSGLDFSVIRLQNNGMIDSSFGTNGYILTDIDGGWDHARKIALQADGRIVVAGEADYDGDDAIACVRYLNNFSVGTNDFSLSKNNVLVYPNPITSVANLQFTLDKKEQLQLDLVSMEGCTIKTILNSTFDKGSHTQKVSLENLPSGFYFLRMRTSKGQVVIKVQKQ